VHKQRVKALYASLRDAGAKRLGMSRSPRFVAHSTQCAQRKPWFRSTGSTSTVNLSPMMPGVLRMQSALVVAGMLITACGLSLADGQQADSGTLPPSPGSSSSSSSSGQSSGEGTGSSSSGMSSGFVPDAATDGPSASSSSGGGPDASPPGPCAGKPSPNLVANGRCYWLSRVETMEPNQASACQELDLGGKATGVPFVPSAPAMSVTIPSDYFIPGDLMAMPPTTAKTWLRAKRLIGERRIVFGAGSFTSYPWEWSDGSTTFLDVEGSPGECLQALPTVGAGPAKVPKGKPVDCASTESLRAVCQSK
jgi:hypothetical protein